MARPLLLTGLAALVFLPLVSGRCLSEETARAEQGNLQIRSSGSEAGSPQNAPTEQQELQRAIDEAANDRAAIVRNLELFLNKYPESAQRPQIYRAIVESSLQLNDYPRATDYAERLVALNPDDSSMTVMSIQLLDRYSDAAGWRRAISYCSRVLEFVDRTTPSEKSPRVSTEDWGNQKKHDESSLLFTRGRLHQKLSELDHAKKDFESSYALVPNAAAAERLGELAELRKDPNTAIWEYARAFALTDAATGDASRAEMRKKVGNAWRLAHGSEEGLGDYLLRAFDAAAASTAPPKPARNAGLQEPYEFTLRRVSDGAPVPFADNRGKVVVLNFWATWCGPCRAMEPHFDRLASRYSDQKDVVFFALNCDEDEALVKPYLQEEKPQTIVLFADGLEHALHVTAFPTTVILDRTGKIAFRANGFDPDTVDKMLTEALDRALRGAENQSPSAAVAP
jgi:thiol-disulfide isomerase/thioredoxin